MKNHSYFILALLLAGCVENQQHEQQADSTTQTEHVENVEKPAEPAATPAPEPAAPGALPEKIIRERALGKVILLDAANGKPLVEVNDNVQLEAGIPTKGWSSTLITTEISNTQTEGQQLKKGASIIADGKPVGKLLQDVEIEMTFKNNKGVNTGVFHAYVQQSKMKAGSIIENSLHDYLTTNTGRSLSDMKPFIRRFQLKALNINAPYKEYYNYESAADDPSPGYRTVLVFLKDKLIGVVDSRPVQLPGTKHIQLARGYHGYFFDDTDEKARNEYVGKFNEFVNNAD